MIESRVHHKEYANNDYNKVLRHHGHGRMSLKILTSANLSNSDILLALLSSMRSSFALILSYHGFLSIR